MRIAIVSTCLLACSASLSHGSFIEGRQELQTALGDDAAEKLAEDYGGDGQSVAFAHPANDPFGRELEAGLRARGFRVLRGPTPAPDALELSYVADAIKTTPLLRVAMHVDGRVLCRAYRSHRGALEAVGPWTSGRVK